MTKLIDRVLSEQALCVHVSGRRLQFSGHMKLCQKEEPGNEGIPWRETLLVHTGDAARERRSNSLGKNQDTSTQTLYTGGSCTYV
jgi:hypothetical protein